MIKWKKLITKNNNVYKENSFHGSNDENENESIEILIDKINTLFDYKLQLVTCIDNNKQLHRERNNGEMIKTEFDTINSKLLDVINQQETKIQDYLNENMIYKKQLDHLKALYSNNNEKIRFLENKILKNKQEQQPHHLRENHSTTASSVLIENSQFLFLQNSGLTLTSTISLTESTPSFSEVSATLSTTAAQSSAEIKNNGHLSQVGFHLNIIKPK